MKYSHYIEKKKFDAYWEKESALMREAGLTEEEIHQMYVYDWDWFKSRRRFAAHNDLHTFDYDDTRLNLKIATDFSLSHYFDFDSIDNPKLFHALKKLSKSDLDLLLLHVVYEMPVKTIAAQQGCTSSNISNKLRRIRNFLKDEWNN